MLDDALSVLETVVADWRLREQSVDVWEALRTVRVAGASDEAVRLFWDRCGRPPGTIGREHVEGYMTLTAAVNRMCRELRVERTYRRCPELDTIPQFDGMLRQIWPPPAE